MLKGNKLTGLEGRQKEDNLAKMAKVVVEMIRVYKLSRLEGLNKRKLTVVYVCHRTVRMTAVYRLKIKYDQVNSEWIF